MKFSDFFIWCAGSDTELLSHCPQSERNKHIGYGTLVLIPAILAFVSMSFALSTIQGLENQPIIYFLGGFVWSLIIFSFDRFIVSTHRRKMKDRNEIKSPAFFLRLSFALILGIVISHPLVMLYFDGSIKDQIAENVVLKKEEIQNKYDKRLGTIKQELLYLDSLKNEKEQERNAQEVVVAKEIDGEVMKGTNGEIITTGLYGKGPSAENKIKYLEKLQNELEFLQKENDKQKAVLNQEMMKLKVSQDSAIQAYSASTDYLSREMALEQLKESNGIVVLTQYLLMCLFILVDILPFIFKTFSPFGMYDRILWDDAILVRKMNNESRKTYLEKVYQQINEI